LLRLHIARRLRGKCTRKYAGELQRRRRRDLFSLFVTLFQKRPFYDTHVIFIAACQALIAIGFLVYGIVLLVRLNSTKGKSTPAAGNRHRQVILKIVIVLATFSILFGIRAVFFMYRPASGGRFIEGNAFLFFAYLAPDTS
jgi:hypothetical protein